ncbi:glycosyl hydrolase family 18 protein [Blastococcus sp. VKM Ac-2987]|uniref:glycosyl hydrolase family 18 protein n=1 Tax=Blastococcus sp. VKM Ac-2987 TaxID=3004141 RepID=UPI0022AB5164|nr:glycosyl hydrolase family 18 protein [Blastococcus sp. VKM Ac-2987]MCZ2858478.1 glycosyl hydrolase family 18 protein [Blastococcus sp. VKM Ac-2987]
MPSRVRRTTTLALAGVVSVVVATGAVIAVRSTDTPVEPLPRAVVAAYWRADSSPPLPTASDRLNVFFLAFATSAQPSTGRLEFDPDQGSGVTVEQLRADIAAVQARGAAVLLSIGGAVDGGIRMRTDEQVDEVVADVEEICDAYGCDGIDWDLEQGGSGTDLRSLVSASARLKAGRGADFAVTVSAEPGLRLYEDFALAEGEATVDGRTWRGRVCDLYGPQFYDFAQTAAERRADIVATAQRMVDRGLPPSRFAIGTTYAGSALGDPGQMPVEEYLAAYRALAEAGTRVRGAYVWDMTIESAAGYPFAEAFGAELGT